MIIRLIEGTRLQPQSGELSERACKCTMKRRTSDPNIIQPTMTVLRELGH